MTDQRLKNLTGTGRRTFLKWSATVGALLGLERSRFLDVLSDSAGSAMADDGACGTTARSVHLIAGNGGLSWFTQLFPYIQVAKNADGSTLAFYGTPADVVAAPTDNPSVYGKYSPFQTLAKNKQMSVFVAGVNQTHTQTPSTGLQLGSNGLIAALASIQSANPTLLPVMGVNPTVFGTAPGAPNIATVANATGLVDLFNSTASKTILAVPGDAALNEAYYKAFLNLNAAAPRASVVPVYDTARVATNLLGKNLSTQLSVTTADMTRYGVTSGTASNILEIAQCLITGVKAFKLGLTASVIVPAMRDDPHGAFQSATTLNSTVMTLGKILDAFMADCIATPDPSCQSASLADNLVLTITGDTPKNALKQSGWPDGTAANHNLVYVMGGGWIKTGWHGDLDLQGNISTWDPLTGATVAGGNSASLASPAAAAIAYSVARGDSRRVADFGVTVPTGVTYAQQM